MTFSQLSTVAIDMSYSAYNRFFAFLSFGLFLLLAACSPNDQAPADPKLARACFESHRNALPPGSQFEGGVLLDGQIKVRVMDGVGERFIECPAADKGAP
jgi:hypothetical protein